MSKNVYEMVTDRIIEQLENGVIPWEKPWTGVRDGAYNRVSKKSYSILNQMLLKHKGEYATFKQWQELGGHIRKGEKSEIIVFWKIYPIEEIQEDGTKTVKNIPLKVHILFILPSALIAAFFYVFPEYARKFWEVVLHNQDHINIFCRSKRQVCL